MKCCVPKTSWEKEWWTKNMGGSDCCFHREAAEVCPMAVSKLKWTIPTCLFSRLWNCWILLVIPWTVKSWALLLHWLYCAKNYFLKWSVPQTLGQFASFCCLRVSKHRILVWWSFLKELLTNSEPFKGRPSIWHNCADFTAKTLPI